MACTAFVCPKYYKQFSEDHKINSRKHELFPELHLDLVDQRLHISKGNNHWHQEKATWEGPLV